MDRGPHTANTWTGGTLIGPGTEMYTLYTLSGRLAVLRQSVLSMCDNRYLGQSDEDVYLISENIIRRTKGLFQNSVLYSR